MSARPTLALMTKREPRWIHEMAKRSKLAHNDSKNALFGIIQGGIHTDLRSRSLEALLKI